MRIKTALAALAALIGVAMAVPAPVEAGGFHRERVPDGWGRTRTIKHYVYYPRYRHVYKVHPHSDPYAYRYEPRGYYPYRSSRYWVSGRELRHRKHRHSSKYRYAPAWGYPGRKYKPRARSRWRR